MSEFLIMPGETLYDKVTDVDLTFKGAFIGTDSLLFQVDYGDEMQALISFTSQEVYAAYIDGRFKEVPYAGHVQELGS